MYKLAKTAIRKALNVSLTQGKKVISKSPRAKRFFRGILLNYIHIEAVAVADNRSQLWILQNYPDAIEQLKQRQASAQFTYRPLISILVPTYNTDHAFLQDCIQSVQAQTYPNWELIVVDDASPDQGVRDSIKAFAAADKRIKYKFRIKNGHISAATNDALQLAAGEFIALLDHDDILWPNALYENVKALNVDRRLDFIYSDEDKITANRWEHRDLFLKPDWNPEFLESVNYITHFSVLRKKVVEQVGGWRTDYDGAQDWDLFLRVSNATQRVHHIPKSLYSWRISATSAASGIDAKPYALERQRLAIADSLRARGDSDSEVMWGLGRDYWTVERPVKGTPLASIVIPTKNQLRIVKTCIDSIYHHTTYKNFEIILVDTGSNDSAVWQWYEQLAKQHQNLKIVTWSEQPFSYARSCNYGVQHARGEYIVLLNNDIEVITPRWLEILMSDAQRPDVGAVGCKLFYPDRQHIQHAGIGLGMGSGKTAANLLRGALQQNLSLLQNLYANTRHELTAVTAACLMVQKQCFDEVGGFDERFRITYNDVDLCLKLKEAGYRTIYNPMAQLVHHESISIGLPPSLIKPSIKRSKLTRDKMELRETTRLLKRRWKKYIEHDPHLNPNLDLTSPFLEPYIEPGDQAAGPVKKRRAKRSLKNQQSSHQ